MIDFKLQFEKFKSPIYAHWQKKYYQAVKEENFGAALNALRKISLRFKGQLPPYWALELAKVRISIGQFDKAVTIIEKIVKSIDSSTSYNQDTKLFLLKHVEKVHADALKGEYELDMQGRIEGIRYVKIDEINFSNVDAALRYGWPLEAGAL